MFKRGSREVTRLQKGRKHGAIELRDIAHGTANVERFAWIGLNGTHARVAITRYQA